MLKPSLTPEFNQALIKIIQRPFTETVFNLNETQEQLVELANRHDLLTLAQKIKIIQENVARSKSATFVHQGKKIRIINGDKDFRFQEVDLYVRGLQHAYVAIKIAELEKLSLNPARITEYLQKFTNIYQTINNQGTPASFTQAQQATLNFIGVLAQEVALARANAFPAAENGQTAASFKPAASAYKKAFHDLKKATELYNTIEPPEDAICTYTITATTFGPQYTIQLSERLSFQNNIDFKKLVQLEKEKRAARIMSLAEVNNHTKAQAQERETKRYFWYRHNYHRQGNNHGLWFVKFMQENFTAFMCASPPSSTRDLPNPANAWQETLYQIDSKGQVLSTIVANRMAISSPFHIPDAAARVQMAQDSVNKLLDNSRLEKIAAEYIERWGALAGESEALIIPILHQTLVAPVFFYGADRDMIAVKSAANAKISAELVGKEFLIKGKKVKFQLLETNNCINIWHPLINPRDNDIEHSKLLINQAVHLIKNFQALLAANKINDADLQAQRADEVEKLLAFLQNRQRSWLLIGSLSRKNPDKKQQAAIQRICADLFAGKYAAYGLNQAQQQDLTLVMQAAISLKKINHETQVSYLKRKVNNFFRPEEFSVLTPLTSLLFLPVYLGRYLFNTIWRASNHIKSPTRQPSWRAVFLPTLFGYKNKQTFKSSYEEILAGKLGMIFGGCKSALDRAAEVRLNKSAMIDQFYQTGKLIDFDQNDKDYYQYLSYVNHYERTGHQNNVAANRHGSHARKMWETLNHYYVERCSTTTRKIEKICANFREIKAVPTGKNKQFMLQQYQTMLPAQSPLLSSQSFKPQPELAPSMDEQLKQKTTVSQALELSDKNELLTRRTVNLKQPKQGQKIKSNKSSPSSSRFAAREKSTKLPPKGPRRTQ